MAFYILQSVIETIFIFLVLSLLSRNFTKADTQDLSQSFGSIENNFGAHLHPRFGRFRRAADDSVVFPKEEESKAKSENAQPELPKAADGEANKNGTNPEDVESRFGFLGGGRQRPFGGLGQGLISGLANGLLQGGQNGFGGGQNGFGNGFGGQGGGYNQYGGGYNQYPGQYGGGFGGPGYYPGGGFGGGQGFGR